MGGLGWLCDMSTSVTNNNQRVQRWKKEEVDFYFKEMKYNNNKELKDKIKQQKKNPWFFF